jgi:hypothetical protein
MRYPNLTHTPIQRRRYDAAARLSISATPTQENPAAFSPSDTPPAPAKRSRYVSIFAYYTNLRVQALAMKVARHTAKDGIAY